MAPTICSGKKRQRHTIATSTSIRRNGQRQGSHQLNQTLSNIVTFVAKGSMNPRNSTSLRIQKNNQRERNTNSTDNYRHTNQEEDDLNYHNRPTQPHASSASYHRRQQFSFISDNAVTSSTHSDTENSFDLRLAHEILTSNSAATTASSSSSSVSDTISISHHKESTSTPALQCQERIFQRYSTPNPTNGAVGDSDNEVNVSNEIDNNTKRYTTKKVTKESTHSNNIRKHYLSCSDFDFDDNEELLNARALNNSNSSGDDVGSDNSMDTHESDSMTSLDTEKSAKLKRGNHPLLRDKLLAEQQNNNNNKIHNTAGLLSIALKTIKLVKRNQLLQQRLTQLQLETSDFIQSVLANPENRHFRQNIKENVQEVNNV